MTLADVAQRCQSLGALRGTVMLPGPQLLLGTSKGIVAFEWHSYCGPMPVDRSNGTGRNIGPRHPFWNAVQRWLDSGAEITEGKGGTLWATIPKEMRHDARCAGGREAEG